MNTQLYFANYNIRTPFTTANNEKYVWKERSKLFLEFLQKKKL